MTFKIAAFLHLISTNPWEDRTIHPLDYRAPSIASRFVSELPKERAVLRWLANGESSPRCREEKKASVVRAGLYERRSPDAMSELHRHVGPGRSIG